MFCRDFVVAGKWFQSEVICFVLARPNEASSRVRERETEPKTDEYPPHLGSTPEPRPSNHPLLVVLTDPRSTRRGWYLPLIPAYVLN
jgi:hypothetical protein